MHGAAETDSSKHAGGGSFLDWEIQTMPGQRQAGRQSHIMGLELVVGEERVLVNAARVLEVLPPLELNKLHGPELKGQQADDVEGQVDLGGGIVPEDVWAGNLLQGRRTGRGCGCCAGVVWVWCGCC
jgi:hypothetical protein